MKTPNSGPDVAEVTSIEDSITPSNIPMRKLIPMMTNPKMHPITFMESNWWASFMFDTYGLMKSSKVTVANEFKFETFRLEKWVNYCVCLRIIAAVLQKLKPFLNMYIIALIWTLIADYEVTIHKVKLNLNNSSFQETVNNFP